MKRLLIPLLVVLAVGFLVVFAVRVLLGGNEDTWICVDNQWVRHGNPSVPMPQSGCGGNNQ